MLEAGKLLLMALFGLTLALITHLVGGPLLWIQRRFQNVRVRVAALRTSLAPPRVVLFVTVLFHRLVAFIVAVIETALRRPGCVEQTLHSVQAQLHRQYTRVTQLRSSFEQRYVEKRDTLRDRVKRLSQHGQAAVHRVDQLLEGKRQEAVELLDRTQQIVHETKRKNISVRSYLHQILQLFVVLLLHAVAFGTNLIATPVVALRSRALALFRTASPVAAGGPVLNKKVE